MVEDLALALVVVGNQKGSIGIGQENQSKYQMQLKKQQKLQKKFNKDTFKDGRTLHHDVKERTVPVKFFESCTRRNWYNSWGSYKISLEVLGIQDVVAKSLGSANPHNVLKACVNGLKSQISPKILSAIRGKKYQI